MQNINIAFAGTPEIARYILAGLSASIKITLIITGIDKPAGRGLKLTETPVKTFARENHIPLITPQNLKLEEAEIKGVFLKYKIDLVIVVAYGHIIPINLLNALPIGWLNIHFSLLPKYRGAAPIARALENNEQVTGISIIKIVSKLDAGGIFLQKEILIDSQDTSETLTQKLCDLAIPAMLEVLDNLDSLKETIQDETLTSYAHKITKDDYTLNFNDDAFKINAKIRAFNSSGCFTYHNNKLLKIFKAEPTNKIFNHNFGMLEAIDHELYISCNNSSLKILELQEAGSKKTTASLYILANKHLPKQ